MTTQQSMKAYVIEAPGGPEALRRCEIPRPDPRDGWVLIRVRAFGLNRSEWFTRRGDSPNVRFPRVLGIECVGEVVSAPGTDLEQGQRVAAMMGGMGREFDGSYAEYTLVPRPTCSRSRSICRGSISAHFPRCSRPPMARCTPG